MALIRTPTSSGIATGTRGGISRSGRRVRSTRGTPTPTTTKRYIVGGKEVTEAEFARSQAGREVMGTASVPIKTTPTIKTDTTSINLKSSGRERGMISPTIITREQRILGGIGAKIGYDRGAVEVKSFLRTPYTLVRHPIESVKSMFKKETYVQTYQELKKVPSGKQTPGFAGGFLGSLVTAKIGGKVTKTIGTKGIGTIRTIGKKPIAAEKLIQPEILAGKKSFPTAPTKTHLKLFKEQKYKLPTETEAGVFHAAPKPFSKITTAQAGTSELPGLYTAPSVSPHFLKLGEPSGYKLVGLPTAQRPTIVRITPTGIKGIKKVKDKGEFLTTKAEKGKVYVPEIKTEVEGIIPPETQLIKTGSKYYTKYKGVKVPIAEFKVVGVKAIKTPKSKVLTAAKVSSSYGKVSKKPIITPSRTLAVSSYRSKPSAVSSVSLVSPSASSIIKPSKVSKVSYKPSKAGSSFFPSKPSSGYFRGKSSRTSFVPITSSVTRTPTGGSSYFPPPSKEFTPPPPTTLKLGKPLKYKGTKKMFDVPEIKIGKKPKYTPSVEAATFNIKSIMKGKKSAITSGLTLRGL